MCGPVLGQFFLAPLWVYLAETFAVRGAFIIFSGCFLQLVVFGLFFRPVEFYQTKIKGSGTQEIVMDKRQDAELKETTHRSDTRGDLSSDRPKQKSFSIELSLFKNVAFSLCVVGSVFTLLCFKSVHLALPPYLREKRFTNETIAYILSVNALSDLLGRIMFGLLLNAACVKRCVTVPMVYSTTLLVSGVSVILMGTTEATFSITILSILHGFFGGEVMTILTPLLMEYVNQEKLSNALGYISISANAVYAFAPKIMGKNNIEEMLY